MEKKMYKYTQNDNLKNNKKPKEIKLFNNYIPVKKTHAQSNISEYETEPSIQKNFSNKYQKNKPNSQAKSVQTTHNNKFSPKKMFTQNKSKSNFSSVSKSSKGSFCNWNNLNIYDYFSEKVILTQKKFIDYKDNKINTLKKELSLIKQEINLYEKKNMLTNNNSNNNNNNYSKNNSINKYINKSQVPSKILYINKNNSKYLLVNNNNSYMSLNTFYNHEIFNNGEDADKKLEKHLSNLLTENNSDNNLKYKTNNNNNNNDFINDNKKKNLLNIMFQSKKGRYNHNNNNYDHNIKNILKTNNLNTKKEICSKKNLDKEIKHNLYFYTNKIKEKQIQILENNNNNKPNNNINLNLDLNYQTLNQKMNKLFDCFFDYYDQKTNQKK